MLGGPVLIVGDEPQRCHLPDPRVAACPRATATSVGGWPTRAVFALHRVGHCCPVTTVPAETGPHDDAAVGFGILATGGIAASFVRDLAHVPGARAVAVGSRTSARAEAFAAEHHLAAAYGSYEGLLADPAVDVVYVATPHSMHEENVLAALAAGKAVLCEKPLAITARQATRMVDEARRRGLFLAEAMWMRCHPTMRRVVDGLRAGWVGEIRQVRADLGLVAGADPDGRLHDPALGASSLLDIGVYPLTLATWLLGEPEQLHGAAVLDARGVDDSAGLVLSYASGAVATLSCSQQAWTDSTASVAGSGGRVEIPARMNHPTAATRVYGDFPTPTTEVVTEPVIGKGLAHEAIEVVRSLRAGETESPLLPLDDTVLVARLLDRARAACGVRLPADGLP